MLKVYVCVVILVIFVHAIKSYFATNFFINIVNHS